MKSDKNKDKALHSEFEEKLNESRSASERTDADLPAEDGPFQATDRYEKIPIIEEQLKVDKEVVETGRVYITKKVREEDVSIDVPTINEEVDIERIQINEYVDTPPPPVRYEGDTMIVPVLREVSVVVKRLMLVEELHVTKRKVETKVPQHMTLRKEEIVVNRVNSNEGNLPPETDERIHP